MKNIVLIGMPGSGKSTIGVVLAKVLGYEFLDSDLVIQKREGRLLSEIIEQEGVDGFLTIENDVNKSLNVNRTVIATGGSAVYGKEAMEHLKQTGTVIYLRLAYEPLRRRLGGLKKRGVVLRKGQTFRMLYDERTPLYEQYADFIIDEENQTITETLQIIQKKLKE